MSAKSQVRVMTAAAFVPGRTYHVDVTEPGGSRENGDGVADSSGRFTLQLDPAGGAVTVHRRHHFVTFSLLPEGSVSSGRHRTPLENEHTG